jgi:hypothetical protein
VLEVRYLLPVNSVLSLIITVLRPTSYGNMEMMARKKKAKRFRAVTVVKELAREQVGAPPAGKVVLEKKKKPERYKPTLGKLLGEAD